MHSPPSDRRHDIPPSRRRYRVFDFDVVPQRAGADCTLRPTDVLCWYVRRRSGRTCVFTTDAPPDNVILVPPDPSVAVASISEACMCVSGRTKWFGHGDTIQDAYVRRGVRRVDGASDGTRPHGDSVCPKRRTCRRTDVVDRETDTDTETRTSRSACSCCAPTDDGLRERSARRTLRAAGDVFRRMVAGHLGDREGCRRIQTGSGDGFLRVAPSEAAPMLVQVLDGADGDYLAPRGG